MNSLPTILPTLEFLLQGLAQDFLRFNNIFEQAFGSGLNRHFAQTLRSQWASGDFSQLPAIKILSSGMNGALGAYASSTNTIYLNQFLVDGNQPELLTSVLLEEIGHSLDAKLNSKDTLGDEGFVFSALVQGKTLPLGQRAVIQSENDAGFITVNGQSIAVERATWTVSTFAELQNALTQSQTNGTDDIINLTANIRLTSQLPFINENVSRLTINGNNHKISGDANNSGTNDAGDVNLFFIKSGHVIFNDLTLTGGRAQGTDGSGGGAGMGGALFIYGGNITLNNTRMSSNQAIGGNGGSGKRGGSMGLVVIRNSSNDGSNGSNAIFNNVFGGGSGNAGDGGDGGDGGNGGNGGNGLDGTNLGPYRGGNGGNHVY